LLQQIRESKDNKKHPVTEKTHDKALPQHVAFSLSSHKHAEIEGRRASCASSNTHALAFPCDAADQLNTRDAILSSSFIRGAPPLARDLNTQSHLHFDSTKHHLGQDPLLWLLHRDLRASYGANPSASGFAPC
jgi:hypothetical protein